MIGFGTEIILNAMRKLTHSLLLLPSDTTKEPVEREQQRFVIFFGVKVYFVIFIIINLESIT